MNDLPAETATKVSPSGRKVPAAVARKSGHAHAAQKTAKSNGVLGGVELEEKMVDDSISTARERTAVAVENILAGIDSQDVTGLRDTLEVFVQGLSSDDADALHKTLADKDGREFNGNSSDPDDELVADWRHGRYPYKNRMSRKRYEHEKYHLQVELLKLQAWVKETGQKS